MRYTLFKRRSPASLAASVAIHAVLVLLLINIVFRYPLGQLIGIPQPEVVTERVQFVRVAPPPPENTGGSRPAKPVRNATPAPLQSPVTVPTQVLPTQPADSSPSRAAGGSGHGFGVSGSGAATGVEPREPDDRIALTADVATRAPRTVAEDVDSIVSLAIGIYNDSMRVYGSKGALPKWIRKDKHGNEWGLTRDYLALGKVKIPTALLALTTLNAPQGMMPVDARSAAYIRRDILENAQRSISEDEFRAAVKRIRERKERERRQKMLVSGESPEKKPDARP